MDKKNARLARSRAFFISNNSALAERLDDQGANREECHADCDCRNRRDRYLLLPPVGGGARSVRQGGHDTLLDVHRGRPATEHLALGIYAGPQLHFRFALYFTCAHRVYLTVKPVVQQCVTMCSGNRTLPIVHLLGGL